MVHYFNQDKKLQVYVAHDWEIIGNGHWLSCVTLSYATGYPWDRVILPIGNVFRIDAFEDADDFEEAVKRACKKIDTEAQEKEDTEKRQDLATKRANKIMESKVSVDRGLSDKHIGKIEDMGDGKGN